MENEFNQKIALFRYELIIPVVNRTYPDPSALQYYKRITSSPLLYPDGTHKMIAAQTVRYWYDKYRHGGFKALYPKSRSDKGSSRVMTEEIKNKITYLKTSNPRMTATSIYLRLIEDGDISKKDTSLSTITRFVSKIPVHKTTVEDMRAFEMEHSNDLWQLDTTYCPYITMDGKKIRTYLILIVDDHSRMIVGYGFFLEDNAVNVQSVLKQAIKKYGAPKRLYTDNGSSYKNEQLELICAQLQIEISRARPYHGNSKGKVERTFKSVKEQWMYLQDFSQYNSTEQLNILFSEYVSKKNNSPHRSLNQKTPLNVFMEDSDYFKRFENDYIDRCFYHTTSRKVANDSTIHLNTRVYETAQEYIGARVTIKYVPDLSHVYIYQDESYIEIFEVKKVENSKIKRNAPLYSEVSYD